jgi:hypothetical protein
MNAENEHVDDRRQALGEIINYCPFGCPKEDLDEYGYCRHLVGFTNEPKVGGKVETIQPRMRKDPETKQLIDTGEKFVSGSKKHKHLAEVFPGDKLVNPQSPQLDQGIVHMKSAWVSSRVYRATPVAAPAELPEPAKVDRRHPPSVSTTEHGVECDECGLTFRSKTGVASHKRHKHKKQLAEVS